MLNAFTVDVEDYFHPSEVAQSVDRTRWPHLADRVHVGLDILLDALAANDAKATFFVLGWVAQRSPGLIRKIAAAGHEIGCHSHLHRLVYNLSPSEFREDTRSACSAIADACGVQPRCYRAPSYSIVQSSLWALEVLVELGFTRDSSIFPIAHDRYGIPGFNRYAQAIATPSGPILEIPPATVQLRSGRVAPVGGGAYLRLFPYRYTAAGLRRLNVLERHPACLYIHPWELDAGQPRLIRGLVSSIRTYAGVKTVERKIKSLLAEFRFSSLSAAFPCA